MLWVDKHRPKTLDKLSYHSSITTKLQHLGSSGDLPHLLIYGPSGAGKKTRVVALLKEIYGSGVEKLKIDLRQFQTPSGKKVECNVVSSNWHMELTPSDVGTYDRLIVTDLIKDIAQTAQVDAGAKRSFKVVIINEADSLSRDAQSALRRTMEKYMSNLRIILISESTSKILSPIRSRCLLIRIPSPSSSEIHTVLQTIAKKEGLALPQRFGERLAEAADGNLRRGVLMFEAARIQNYPFEDEQIIFETDWEGVVKEIAGLALGEQSPQRLLKVRGMFYELLSHCIPPSIIIKYLAFELMHNVDGQIKSQIVEYAALFEHRLRMGNKAIFHLEAFVARFMSIYKGYLMEIGMA